jgi:hypothetical protein
MGGILLVIVGIVLLFVLGHFILDRDKRRTDIDEYIGTAVLGFIVSLAFSFVLLLIVLTEDGDYDPNVCTNWQTEQGIISVNRDTSITGSFILGTGAIGSTQYYYAYVEKPDGYLLERYRIRNTFIVEGTQEPKVVFKHYTCPKKVLSFLWFGEYERTRKDIKRVIHVPTNTILREFKL